MASGIVVVIIFVLLALAILFICQNGGWQGGCGGNCAGCHALVKAFPAGKAFFKWLCFPILFSFPGFAFLLPYA